MSLTVIVIVQHVQRTLARTCYAVLQGQNKASTAYTRNVHRAVVAAAQGKKRRENAYISLYDPMTSKRNDQSVFYENWGAVCVWNRVPRHGSMCASARRKLFSCIHHKYTHVHRHSLCVWRCAVFKRYISRVHLYVFTFRVRSPLLPTAIIIIIKRKTFALDWDIYRICIHIQV